MIVVVFKVCENMCHHFEQALIIEKYKNTRAILERFMPLESELGFLEHDLYQLIEVSKIYRKRKYH